MAWIIQTSLLKYDLCNDLSISECRQRRSTQKFDHYDYQKSTKDRLKKNIQEFFQPDDSTDESDNGQESPKTGTEPARLNINSKKFDINKFKKRSTCDEHKHLHQSSILIEGSLDNHQIRNVVETHPKGNECENANRKKYSKNKHRKSSHTDYQEATVVKPRRKFGNKQEKERFVESYKQKKKTELCKNWEMSGTCKFGSNCAFAHGKDELVIKNHVPQNYKTKMCKQFHEDGYCPYGHRCQFLHLSTQKDVQKYTYQDILKENLSQFQSKNEALGSISLGSNLFNFVSHKRLDVFKHIWGQEEMTEDD